MFIHYISNLKSCYLPLAVSMNSDLKFCDLPVQIQHAPDGKQGFSFGNTWIKQLAFRLPTLALAVDDALLAFAERVADVLNAPRAPPLHAAVSKQP